jgi:hypothetical protein
MSWFDPNTEEGRELQRKQDSASNVYMASVVALLVWVVLGVY